MPIKCTTETFLHFVESGGVPLLVDLAVGAERELAVRVASLGALCNLCEAEDLTEAIWRAGGSHLFALLKKNDPPLQRMLSAVLFGLLEHEDGPRVALHFEPNIVHELVAFARKFNSRTSWGVVRAAFGSIAALASHPETRAQIVSANALDVLEAPGKDPLSDWLACLARAHVLEAPSLRLNRKKKDAALLPLHHALKLFEPKDVRKLEDDVGLLWTNLGAFVRLIHSDQLPIMLFGVLACAALLLREDYAALLPDEDAEELQCLQYHPDERVRKLGKTMRTGRKGPPRLEALCKAKVRALGLSAGEKKKAPKTLNGRHNHR